MDGKRCSGCAHIINVWPCVQCRIESKRAPERFLREEESDVQRGNAIVELPKVGEDYVSFLKGDRSCLFDLENPYEVLARVIELQAWVADQIVEFGGKS
jgi:hypothetical protein